MKATKIFNYIAGVIALINAGTTSYFSQQISQLPDISTDLNNYEAILKLADTLPASYFVATSLLLLVGSLLLVFGIVTLILNFRLNNTLAIKRLAIWTSLATIIGVFIGLVPIVNTFHSVLLSILYIISGYFMRE